MTRRVICGTAYLIKMHLWRKNPQSFFPVAVIRYCRRIVAVDFHASGAQHRDFCRKAPSGFQECISIVSYIESRTSLICMCSVVGLL